MTTWSHPRTGAATLLFAAFLATAAAARAAELWVAQGSLQVRHDVQFLVDEGVIDVPVSGWPIPADDLRAALERMPAQSTDPAAVSQVQPAHLAAIERLRRLLQPEAVGLGIEVSGAANPIEMRTFQRTPREEGELSAYVAGSLGERFGGRLQLTAAADPADDKSLRLDGSYVAGKFGNWLVTLGAQDRWWGSGWEGSLILSNNARPVPTISLDRAVSTPFETPWLSWLGPWRLTTFMGRMENGRDDYDHPLLFGMRISVRPLDGLEISVDRAAQWCGEGRSCSLQDFWNLFTGRDNEGENVRPEDEPGNQLASWDIRWASPIGTANYAIYNQHTGETIDNKIPRPYRSMDIVGVETWGADRSSGASWRAGLEWANTRCGGTENGEKLWDCAYNHHIFSPDGYTYYDRVVGHSMDGDGTMCSARYIRVDPAANTLSVIARYTLVNEGGNVPDSLNSIASGPETWISLDTSYRFNLGRGWVEGGVGGDHRDRDWKGDTRLEGRAWLTWHQPLR